VIAVFRPEAELVLFNSLIVKSPQFSHLYRQSRSLVLKPDINLILSLTATRHHITRTAKIKKVLLLRSTLTLWRRADIM